MAAMASSYESFTKTLDEVTGLSPMGLFTVLAVMAGVYHLVSTLFFVDPAKDHRRERGPAPAPAPAAAVVPREPVQVGEITEEELLDYDGSDPQKPLLMAIKAQIYDVTRSKMFYGPGGPYAMFSGRDASRALALMSFDPKDLTGNTEGLATSELNVLQDWEYKFMEKYVKVGTIKQVKLPSIEEEAIPEGGKLAAEKEASKRDTSDSQTNANE